MLTLQNIGGSCLTNDFAFTITPPPSRLSSLSSLFDHCVVFCVVVVVFRVIVVVV